MQAHCTEVGPVNISSETHTVEFESLSHAIDAWKGSHDASALARRQAEKIAEVTAPGQTDSEDAKLARRENQKVAAIDKLTKKGGKQQEEAGADVTALWQRPTVTATARYRRRLTEC